MIIGADLGPMYGTEAPSHRTGHTTPTLTSTWLLPMFTAHNPGALRVATTWRDGLGTWGDVSNVLYFLHESSLWEDGARYDFNVFYSTIFNKIRDRFILVITGDYDQLQQHRVRDRIPAIRQWLGMEEGKTFVWPVGDTAHAPDAHLKIQDLFARDKYAFYLRKRQRDFAEPCALM